MSSLDFFNLSGKTAVVTGASEGGLGYWSAVALAQAGANVVVSDVASAHDGLDEAVTAIRDLGADALAWPADVTSPNEIDALVDAAQDRFGRIDILVHQAGVMLRKPTFDTSLEEWERVLRVNLTGTFLTNRAVARLMVEQGSGSIINTSTIYTNIVGPLPEAAYYASKAGVANLTRGFASEWGSAGVNVNCIAPGVFYPTRMTQALSSDPQRLEQMAGRTMLGRLGDPESDLAGTVVWLASDAAKYVTGQVIFVDGGWTAK